MSVISELGADAEVALLRDRIAAWLETVDDEVQEPLTWAFAGTPKHFRPLTLFGCHRAMHGPPRADAVELAFAMELMHSMSLVIDDVLDASDERRGIDTVLRRFGSLPALMTSGYLVADAFDAFAEDPFAIRHLARSCCNGWGRPSAGSGGSGGSRSGWRTGARSPGEDTGSMFEICAGLGTRDRSLRQFGHLVGVLYHGCDDVADLRGTRHWAAARGGYPDGIVTLPAAIAVRDPEIRDLFGVYDDDPVRLARSSEAVVRNSTRRSGLLDRVADSAREEALHFAAAPEPLLALVDQVRQLSQR